jgi:type I restriction enzyme, S subunit
MKNRTLKLGTLCKIEKGTTGIQKAIPGEYPLVVTGEARKSHNDFQFDCEAVIVPLVSSTGHGHRSLNRIHFQTGKFALGSILCAIIPIDNQKLNAEFLFHYLNFNKERELVSRMKGMANVTLPMKEIADIDIPDISIKDQLEFVKFFELVEFENKAVGKEFTHQLSLVKQLRQAFLREAMQGKLVPQNPADEPANELLRKIKAKKEQLIKDKKLKKEKPLPPIKPEEIPCEIPENWVWCRLGEICDVNPRNKVEDGIDAGFIPMPLISQLFGVKPTYEIRKWGTIKSGFTHFANDDVVVAKITPCFENSKAGIISELPNGIGAGTTELNVLRGNQFVLPRYIYAFVKRIDFLKNGEKIMKGVAGQQRVPTEYFYKTLIPLPPLSEQNRIVQKLEQLMQLCDGLEQSITQSQQQNEMLLQQVLREALEPKENSEILSIQ